jgi:hypothetical protein
VSVVSAWRSAGTRHAQLQPSRQQLGRAVIGDARELEARKVPHSERFASFRGAFLTFGGTIFI